MNRHRSEVQDWMTPDPITISSSATLLEASGLMDERDVRRLPVVDKSNELIGIITLSDIQKVMPTFEHGRSGRDGRQVVLSENTVQKVMAETPVTAEPDDLIQDAAEAMLEYQVSGLPVVQGSELVGIITESDIFRLVVESWAAVLAD